MIVNRSDSTGGAAVVARRLMEALRAEGVDARMLVAEKLTDSPFIARIASSRRIKWKFLAERLGIFLRNGLRRDTLFKIDTADCGVDISRHPWVREADAISLHWVNQGMLSLKDIRNLLRLGKPVSWTMHDMWCMTGVCHHAGECREYRDNKTFRHQIYREKEVGKGGQENYYGESEDFELKAHKCTECPLLERHGADKNLAHKTWGKKSALYGSDMGRRIKFVPVSNWLAHKARESGLLSNASVTVIPNPLPIQPDTTRYTPIQPDTLRYNPIHSDTTRYTPIPSGRVNLLFGAARLDDPIKGLPILIETTRILRREYPELASRVRLTLYGGIKDASLLEGVAVEWHHTGMLRDAAEIRRLFEESHMVLSTSLYETLPTTLVEGQLYGAMPVAIERGGQADIITHGRTGLLVKPGRDAAEDAARMAAAIAEGVAMLEEDTEIAGRMRSEAERKFSAKAVAQRYIELLG